MDDGVKRQKQRQTRGARRISRRGFVIAAAGGALGVLAACGDEPAPVQPPAQPAAAPAAPAAPATQPSPTAALAAAARPAPAPAPTVAAPRPTRAVTTPAATPAPTTPPPPTAAPTSTPMPTPTPEPTPTEPPILSPLTGRAVSAEVAARRVVAVKIDNAPSARPQSGLSTADVVYEHLTEGPVTRYTAFFQESGAQQVGPIRSSRFVDRDLVQQFDALFVHVGASPPVMDDLRAAPVADLDQFFYDETRPYYRVSSRPAPFNMYANLAWLRDAGAARHPQRREIPSLRFYAAEPDLGSLSTLRIPAGPRTLFQSEYAFDAEARRWRRSIGGTLDVDAETGDAVAVENVIVQRVSSRLTEHDEDSLGNKSLWIGTTGEGAVSVFRDGARHDGVWRRASPTDVTEFFDADGAPLDLRPGQTWVHLLSDADAIEVQ